MQDFLIKQIAESISSARNILKEKMTTFGVADRWPSLLATVEELMSTKSLPLAQFFATKSEPMMSWINAEITQFEDYQIELKMRIAPHLFVGGSWDLSVFTGSSFLPIKWLLEKHAPPGQLKMRVRNIELQNDFPILEGVLFARTSVTPEELENFVNTLLKSGGAQFEANIGFFSTQEKRMAQTHLKLNVNGRLYSRMKPKLCTKMAYCTGAELRFRSLSLCLGSSTLKRKRVMRHYQITKD